MAYTSVPLLVLLCGSILLCDPLHALNSGLFDGVNVINEQCSRTCESKFCDGPPTPLLRYGKYCGVLYSGCPGEQPCDGLDECCMHHDQCIDQMNNNNYSSEKCNKELVVCVEAFKGSSFNGNTCDVHTVAESIRTAITPVFAAQAFGN